MSNMLHPITQFVSLLGLKFKWIKAPIMTDATATVSKSNLFSNLKLFNHAVDVFCLILV